MDFLPEGYEVPKSAGNYMKFEEGENRFRILGKAIIGYLYWVTEKDGKRSPRRVHMNDTIPIGELEGDDKPKHFWAMPVYNFDVDKIQILEITQKGLHTSIKALVDNKKWGNPENYNLAVTRVGKDFNTKYSVQPEPQDKAEEELLKDVRKQYKEMNIDLDALYEGGDPFANSEDVLTEEFNNIV